MVLLFSGSSFWLQPRAPVKRHMTHFFVLCTTFVFFDFLPGLPFLVLHPFTIRLYPSALLHTGRGEKEEEEEEEQTSSGLRAI